MHLVNFCRIYIIYTEIYTRRMTTQSHAGTTWQVERSQNQKYLQKNTKKKNAPPPPPALHTRNQHQQYAHINILHAHTDINSSLSNPSKIKIKTKINKTEVMLKIPNSNKNTQTKSSTTIETDMTLFLPPPQTLRQSYNIPAESRHHIPNAAQCPPLTRTERTPTHSLKQITKKHHPSAYMVHSFACVIYNQTTINKNQQSGINT
ncbi:hypothetical protein ECC02_002779 [Trypanosoma cruzi]|uniref:Uncharacterized protein n=1 Tax=Trypanosoma cruzi TaxID=5693 RepID=A0A7J6YCF0_TRYCR|nr:hypothetical protein ECC02_002779 [Trypanosoma cruzi]